MVENWIDTQTDDEARKRAGAFWAQVREDIDAGEFWADEIKKYRSDPAKRLRLALANLPLPAAFREAAVAVRALIRAKRKASEPIEEDLSLLYWLAAVRSFMLDYAPRLQEPGFNVVEAIPGERLRSLPYKYSELGYRELSLLNKTDVKWLTEVWGEPTSHSTLNDIHKELWAEYETKLIEQRSEADRRFQSELDSLLSPAEIPNRGQGPAPRSSCIIVVAAVALGAIGGACWIGG